jgi:hypothetical protein
MTGRTFEDAFNLLCGEKIGSGIHRDVFECRIRKDLVVKVEIDETFRTFANVDEMKFWSYYQYIPKVAAWLAPCEYMSQDGRILLQRRATPITDEKTLPEKMPMFLTDFKASNYGWINGNLVCVDYAYTIRNPSTRPQKVHWA